MSWAGVEITLEVRGWRGSQQGEDSQASVTGPMPTVLAGERDYVYVIMDDQWCGIYKAAASQLAIEVFRVFRVAVENESEKRMGEFMSSWWCSRMNNWGTHQCLMCHAPPIWAC